MHVEIKDPDSKTVLSRVSSKRNQILYRHWVFGITLHIDGTDWFSTSFVCSTYNECDCL